MKKIRFGLPLVAILIAFAAAAFSTRKVANDTYWFPTDASGSIVNSTISISGHTTKPCNGSGDYCALGFNEDQVVVDNPNGTVTLRGEVAPLEDGIPSLED